MCLEGASALMHHVGAWMKDTCKFLPMIVGTSDTSTRLRLSALLRPLLADPMLTLESWMRGTRKLQGKRRSKARRPSAS